MATYYTWEDDQVFGDAIWSYQNNDDVHLLEKWLNNCKKITNHKYIEELLYQIFMEHDSYFVSGTAPTFSKAFKLCENDQLIEIKSGVCPDVWFESPHDFNNLLDAIDMSFCADKEGVFSRRQMTVAELFVGERLDTVKGFWNGVKSIYYAAFIMDSSFDVSNMNVSNLAENVNTWLSKIPDIYKFIEPYCPSIKGDVLFHHIAYAYLNHGMEIEEKILGLYPTKNPDVLDVFKKASEFHILDYSLSHKEGNSKVKLKL